MRYDDIDPELRQAIGFHEALRRLGFRADDIYFMLIPISQANVDPVVADGHERAIAVVLRTQGRQFATLVAPTNLSDDGFPKVWANIVSALNSGEIPDEDLARVYGECRLRKGGSSKLIVSLVGHGITPPKIDPGFDALMN